MFTELTTKHQQTPIFKSTSELLGAYFKDKRNVINNTHPILNDEWPQVIQCLCDEMSNNRCLSIPSEYLDPLVWRKLNGSLAWFLRLLKQGLLREWLCSQQIKVHQLTMNYMHHHAKHAGDQITALLWDFKDRDDAQWNKSFADFFTFCRLESSYDLFQLFLHCFETGKLKDFPTKKMGTSSFWSQMHSLIEKRPEWIAELMSRWLKFYAQKAQICGEFLSTRKLNRYLQATPDNHHSFYEAAKNYPESFLVQLFPLLIEITQAHLLTPSETDALPQQDRLWSYDVFDPSLVDFDSVYPKVIENALIAQHQKAPENLAPILPQLKANKTDFCNHLLLSLYLADINYFAQEAMLLLTQEPWRLICPVIGSFSYPYWKAQRLLKGLAEQETPLAWPELVSVLLKFRHPEYDNEEALSAFNFLSALPPKCLSKAAKAFIKTMQAKGHQIDSEPRQMQMQYIDSPVPTNEFTELSDAQLLTEFKRYNNSEARPKTDETGQFKGTARQLAQLLKTKTEAIQ